MSKRPTPSTPPIYRDRSIPDAAHDTPEGRERLNEWHRVNGFVMLGDAVRPALSPSAAPVPVARGDA
jgi:hypothetical protein